MKALVYLYLQRIKGNIRNVFSKPSSGIFAGFMILLYGGLFIGVIINGNEALSMYNINNVNTSIFIGIGFTAMMVCVMLMQSRKSLFTENDAFYLFAGPFKRSHIMQFIMSQSIVNALMCGAVSLFIMMMMGNDLQYTIPFIVLTFLSHCLVYLFFTTLYYYVYLLYIRDEKYKHLSLYVVGFFAIVLIGIIVAVWAENGFVLNDIAWKFLASKLFYIVPLFGWIKMTLVSYIAGDMVLMCTGILLMLIACGVIYYLMVTFKGDFIEKAMQDAVEFTARYKEMKAGGRTSLKDKKIREVKSKAFREGAGAILSKNLLLMKKSNTFLSYQDFIFIGIYLVISLIMDLGFGFFMYMMLFWLFISIQNAEFMREMDNYQIYLIPDTPLRKLWYLLAPYFLKYVVLAVVPIIIGSVLLHAQFNELIQYYVMLAGYACLFISASVLATRVLKSRNNPTLENMLRMLVILAASLPSIILVIAIIAWDLPAFQMITSISVVTLLMNFVISALIIYSCRNMMNGREIKSE